MGLNSTGSQKLPVPILEDIPMVKIASGADHLVCLSQEGYVYTCGCAEQGQLGRVAEVFSNRGGRKGKNYLLTPQPVALGRGKKKTVVDDIWTGSYCTFVRAKDTGLIYVFGLNNYSQLGYFLVVYRFLFFFLFFFLQSSLLIKLVISGLPDQDTRFQPEVSKGFIGHRWLSISSGQHHTLALDEDGKNAAHGRLFGRPYEMFFLFNYCFLRKSVLPGS